MKKNRVLTILLNVIMVLVLFTACGKEENREGQLQIPIGSSAADGKYYEDIVKQFQTAGFTDVTTREVPDLINGWINKEGDVESVSVNGDTSFSKDDWVAQDASIVVAYHTFPDKGEKTSEDKTEEKSEEKTTEANHDGQIQVPVDSSGASGSNYEDIVTRFEKAGFTNVTTREVPDLITGWVNKEGDVDSVSIDGDTGFSADAWFAPDATVVVSYHVFKDDSDKGTEKGSDDGADKKESKKSSSKYGAAYDGLDTTTQNAYKSGMSYLEGLGGFSRQGLIDQLSSEYGEQFTLEQAQNAVAAIEADGNVDWKEQAVISAKSYLEFQSFSREGLIDQLTSEYGEQFTREEAEYAADQVGLK